MGFLQGIAGNMQQLDEQQAQAEYGPWLLEGEQLRFAFRTLRDGFCITSRRLITIDRQGATGKKARIKSIALDAIFDVTAETAGGGIDDSEITVAYIVSPNRRATSLSYDQYTFEFPRNFDVAWLYRYLMTVAADNVGRLNS